MFVTIFKRVLHKSRDVLEELLDFRVLAKAHTMRELDSHLAQRVYGFKHVEHYWEEASPVHRLGEFLWQGPR
jgi:predicted alpha/beta-fold hydrolase